MSTFQLPSKTLRSSLLVNLLLISAAVCIIYLLVSVSLVRTSTGVDSLCTASVSVPTVATSLDHLVFGIASTSKSWPERKEYVRLWWQPQNMRGCVFVDNMPASDNDTNTLPPLCLSQNTSQFRYTCRGGLRSAIRVARVVLETVALNNSDVQWFVFGDDDTVFIPGNLVQTLSKYDHTQWYYIGSISEAYEQNAAFSFDMGFGGAGFAISHSLARVLAKVLDSCLERYPHLYGSDARIFSCLAELGVELTHEPGFHQVDMKGNLLGWLSAHPLAPLVSLHHSDYIEPIFPNMTTNQAIQHLYNAVKVDSARILQRAICYDRWFSWTISISWGYAVQVFQGNKLLPDLLPVQETYSPWNKKGNLYMFNKREFPIEQCKRPTIFYLDGVVSGKDGIIKSNYRRNQSDRNCLSKRLEEIIVFSHRLDLHIRQAPRRHCCDVLPSSVGEVVEIGIRECKEEELVFMH